MDHWTEKQRPAQHAMSEYLALPKEMGTVSSDELLKIADTLLLDEQLASSNLLTQPKIVAASALIEAALVSSDTESIDGRLYCIDTAEELAKEVAGMELHQLESGHKHPDDLENWLRATLQTMFMDSYRDIVCGDVTVNHTKPELIKNLQSLHTFLSRQQDLSYTHTLHGPELGGLAGEITVLIDTWQRYKSPHDPIALPSTYRGGSGVYNREQTHDIIFATQTLDESITDWDFSYAEVKRGNGYRLHDLGRYAHSILHVTDAGTRKVA